MRLCNMIRVLVPLIQLDTFQSNTTSEAFYASKIRYQILESQYDKLQAEFQSTKIENEDVVHKLYVIWRSKFPNVSLTSKLSESFRLKIFKIQNRDKFLMSLVYLNLISQLMYVLKKTESSSDSLIFVAQCFDG